MIVVGEIFSTEASAVTAEKPKVTPMDSSDFLKSRGIDKERRDEVCAEVETYFGDRIFSYKHYSGTVSEMKNCPVFYAKAQEGFEAAVEWLLENDEAGEEVVVDEEEIQEEQLGEDIETITDKDDEKETKNEADIDKKPQPVEQEKLKVEKITEDSIVESIDKQQKVEVKVQAFENNSGDASFDKVSDEDISIAESVDTKITTNDIAQTQTDVATETVVVMKDTDGFSFESNHASEEKLDIDEIEQPVEDAVLSAQTEEIDAIEEPHVEVVENVQVSKEVEAIELIDGVSNTEPIVEQSIELKEEKLDNETDQMPLLVNDDNETEIEVKIMPPTEVESNTVPELPSLEEMLPTEEDLEVPELVESIVEPEIPEVIEYTPESNEPTQEMIETIIALTNEVPDVVTKVQISEIRFQSKIVVDKIEAFNVLKTAEECREALIELRGELELLLLQLGYKEASAIAEKLTRQYDMLVLKEYIRLLIRTLQSTQKINPSAAPKLKILRPFHHYGTHAVRTVVNYA